MMDGYDVDSRESMFLLPMMNSLLLLEMMMMSIPVLKD
jgi:hypothetical protein